MKQSALLEKRIKIWQGRISPYAVAKSAEFYKRMFSAYAITCGGIIVFIVCSTLTYSVLGICALIFALAIGLFMIMLAYRAVLSAGADVARQYSLPDRMRGKIPLKDPAGFDRWCKKHGITPQIK